LIVAVSPCATELGSKMVANRSSAVPPRITAHGPPKAGKLAQRAVFRDSDENIIMSLPKLTGNLFRAGRALAGLTRDDLPSPPASAATAIRKWETSSDAIRARCTRTSAAWWMCSKARARWSYRAATRSATPRWTHAFSSSAGMFAFETDRDGKRAFNIRAASPSFILLFPILPISRLA
jgi:hypothetical protein